MKYAKGDKVRIKGYSDNPLIGEIVIVDHRSSPIANSGYDYLIYIGKGWNTANYNKQGRCVGGNQGDCRLFRESEILGKASKTYEVC